MKKKEFIEYLKMCTTLVCFNNRIKKLFKDHKQTPSFQRINSRIKRIDKRWLILSIKEHKTFYNRSINLYEGLLPFIKMNNKELYNSNINSIKIGKGGCVKQIGL